MKAVGTSPSSLKGTQPPGIRRSAGLLKLGFSDGLSRSIIGYILPYSSPYERSFDVHTPNRRISNGQVVPSRRASGCLGYTSLPHGLTACERRHCALWRMRKRISRSEEHTSELQS